MDNVDKSGSELINVELEINGVECQCCICTFKKITKKEERDSCCPLKKCIKDKIREKRKRNKTIIVKNM